MSLPESHHPLDGHEHKGQTCPFTGQGHAYCPPQKGDSRSPCPALNTMANHGYISRDGKNLSPGEVMSGLKACYGLSTFLAAFLSYVSFFFLRGRRLSLYDIGKHNIIEHDASMVHHDTPEGDKYAPTEIDQALVEALIQDIKPDANAVEANSEDGEQFLLGIEDIARARIRREKECRTVTPKVAMIAGGEMALILGIMEVKSKRKIGVPVEIMRNWIGHERLPEGWKPDRVMGFWALRERIQAIAATVKRLRLEEAANDKAK